MKPGPERTPTRIAKTKLSDEQLLELRRFYARHGHNRAIAKLKSSSDTVHTLMSGGGARRPVVERLVEQLAIVRAS